MADADIQSQPTFKWDNFNTFIIQDKTSKSGKWGVDRNNSSLLLNDAIKMYNTPGVEVSTL